MQEYLINGVLPENEQEARRVVLTSSNFTVLDGILYHLEPDKTLRVVPPCSDRRSLFDQAHSGVFGAHLKDAKIHSALSRHYWWPGMRADIVRWCKGCATCASRSVGRSVKPPLVPIPVSGPFDRVGVDIIQFPKSSRGHQYAVVFVDYLTKWPEVFPVRDQTALTVAHLLVEHVISRHGVPTQLLSDRGAAFMSQLVKEIGELMGFKKVNTTSYHPQTDGLVERFNRTLIDMLAKTVAKNGRDWDERLPYVLFAYRASMQASTMESPFYLLYGRDPRLPCEQTLTPPVARTDICIDDYKSETTLRLQDAWELARANVKKAQRRQKAQHDKHSRKPPFKVGDRVFLFMPAIRSGKAYKFACPYKGPYRILQLYPNGAELKLIERPHDPGIRVALNRLRCCPKEIASNEDHFPPTDDQLDSTTDEQLDNEISHEEEHSPNSEDQDDILKDSRTLVNRNDVNGEDPIISANPWTGRLRSHRNSDCRGRQN